MWNANSLQGYGSIIYSTDILDQRLRYHFTLVYFEEDKV